MAPAALTRIHSILNHAVAMRDEDVMVVCNQAEAILSDGSFTGSPQLQACVSPDGWVPIASLLNYSPLGATVWPFGGVGVVADCLNTRGSHLIELSGDQSCVRKKPLRVQVRSAIEWIFSDENYHKDVHLQLLQGDEGFVPLMKIISSYNTVQQLLRQRMPVETVPDALATSAELVVRQSMNGSEGLSVRRKTLAEKICSQVEWYLSEKQLQTDRFLYETTCDHDGWIPVSTLLSFPRMRKLCHPQVGAVAHVLSSSPRLEVSPDMTLVRPGRAPPSSPARAATGAGPTFESVADRIWTEHLPTASQKVDFTLMTYNVLADMLCTVEQFSSVDVGVLDWQHRRALVTREIVAHMPDIMCLQELQGNAAGAGSDDHHAHMRDFLHGHGYEGRYMRKMKRNGIGWPHTQIGNAIFWRTATFEYLEHEEIPIAILLNAMCEDEPSSAHFGRGAQVGLAAALRHRSTGRTVVAVTTHLSCNFQEPWTQVAQIQTVLMSAAKLAEKHGPNTAVVMGADLNSIPGSGVYHLVTSGHLPASHPHLTIIAEHVEMPQFGENGECGGGSSDLTQPLQMKSAYSSILGQEPLFTNFTPGFVGTLDYIFGNEQLNAVQVLMLPSEDDVRREGFLPASAFPSDHLYLAAKFSFSNASSPTALMPPPPVPPVPTPGPGPVPVPESAPVPRAVPIGLPSSKAACAFSSNSDGGESPTKKSRTASGPARASGDWRKDTSLPAVGTVSLASRPPLQNERLSSGSQSEGSQGDSEGGSVHSSSGTSHESLGIGNEQYGERYGHAERHGGAHSSRRRHGLRGGGGRSKVRR